jgi:hypothetical protein
MRQAEHGDQLQVRRLATNLKLVAMLKFPNKLSVLHCVAQDGINLLSKAVVEWLLAPSAKSFRQTSLFPPVYPIQTLDANCTKPIIFVQILHMHFNRSANKFIPTPAYFARGTTGDP